MRILATKPHAVLCIVISSLYITNLITSYLNNTIRTSPCLRRIWTHVIISSWSVYIRTGFKVWHIIFIRISANNDIPLICLIDCNLMIHASVRFRTRYTICNSLHHIHNSITGICRNILFT